MRAIFFYELKDRLEEITDKMVTGHDDAYNEEEKSLIAAIVRIKRLANTARKKGLLELEESAASIGDTGLDRYLKKLLFLVLDGTNPELVEEIGYSLYLSGYYRGYEGLIALIYLEGVLSIQAGEHPMIIEERLYALVPAYIRELKDIIGETEEESEDEVSFSSHIDIDALCKTDSKLIPSDNGYHMVRFAEYCLGKLDKRSISRMLRDIDNNDLVICIVGFNGNTRRKIFDCISEKLGNMLADDIFLMGPVHVNDIIGSVTKLMNIYIRLLEGGEVVADDQELIKMINSVFGKGYGENESDVQKNARYLHKLVDSYETVNNRTIYIV